jgi:3-phosphoshikimate 1-carboxyvinyltransferase
MIAVIKPGMREGKPVRIPGSKSMSHRALIAAALSEKDTVIRGLVENNDTAATMDCLAQLGAAFEPMKDGSLFVHGIGYRAHYSGEVVDCGESGSTLRFLIPLFSLCGTEVVFTGHGKLMSRPQSVYQELFEKQGLLFQQ